MTEENLNIIDTTAQPPQDKRALAVSIAVLSLVIAFCSFAFAYFTLQKLAVQKKHLIEHTQTEQLLKTNLEQQAASFQQEISTRIAKNEATLNQSISEANNIKSIAAVSEAAYLFQVAQNAAEYSGDPATAKTRLQLALTKLDNLQSPEAVALQQKITAALQLLSQGGTLNKQELLQKLDAFISAIKQIPVFPEPLSPPKAEEVVTSPSLWDRMKYNLAKMKSLVVIQKIDNPETYAFSPQDKILLKQFILIKLAQAEWAVVNLDQPVYQQSLALVKQLLLESSLPKEQASSVLTQLNQLSSVTLTPKMIFNSSSPATNGSAT